MSGGWHDPVVHRLADHGLHVQFGETIDVGLSQRIAALTRALRAEAIPGVRDLVPSYTTLVVVLDPATVDRDGLEALVTAQWADTRVCPDDPVAGRTDAAGDVVIPVAYGGANGPDLRDVARSTGLTPGEVVRRHAGASYVVGALGFAPGFAFLVGLPSELATPRRATPRTEVPPGSVGIGGRQTGVYALPTAGGWSLIGRTPLRLFDPSRDQPSLLQTGDAVRFEPIDEATFRRIRAREHSLAPVERAGRSDAFDPRPGLEVLAPGLLTSVQDLGRRGLGHLGVTPGGAVDRGALIAGNRLVGNDDGAAALEITLAGSHLRFLRPARIAIAGAELGARLNGHPFPAGRARVIHHGDELTFDPGATRVGVRAYLCVSSASGSASGGGIDVPLAMGSRSTDLTAGFGGFNGRPLQAGDRLSWMPATGQRRTSDTVGRPGPAGRDPFRVVRGPQAARFSENAWRQFLTERWRVSSASNRVGIRLDGPSIVARDRTDMISEGLVTGAVQITGEGQPIVMLPARATIGGYPRIATVVAADLDRLGQLGPGDRIRFAEVGVDTVPESPPVRRRASSPAR